MSNNQQLTIYHDNLQVILHDEDLNKIVLWDSHNRSIVVRDLPKSSPTDSPRQQHQQLLSLTSNNNNNINNNNSIASTSNSNISTSVTQHVGACPYCHRPFDHNNSIGNHSALPSAGVGSGGGGGGGGVTMGGVGSVGVGGIGSTTGDSYMSRDYFLLLESSSSDIPSSIPSKSNDPFSAEFLNSGYYRKFFKETKKIGAGGFGAVYHCRHLINTVDLGEFAVKKVPVGENLPWLYRVLQEVKALETLQKHKNIINYKHSWLEYDQPANFGPKVPCLFILMEYANSGNLQDYMSEKQIIPENEIWSFFIDLCHGIGYLHHSEIIHRDLKPQNILLHQYYDPVCDNLVTHLMISDFGTCDTVSGFKERLKRTGNTGTVEYVAPELFEKSATGEFLSTGTDKCDIWSLGILLYEMAYGKLPYKHSGNPFIDDDPERDVDLLVNEIGSFCDSKFHIPSNPPRSKELKETILALLRRNPHDRPSINQILLTPFVQMKTKHMSINPINIIKESPSIRKATIRKRNLKKSKEILVEQLDSYDTDEDLLNNTTTTISTTTSHLSTSIVPPFRHHHHHHHPLQTNTIEDISTPTSSPTLPNKSTSSSSTTTTTSTTMNESSSSSNTSLVLMKKNVTTLINDTAQQTALSLSNAIANHSPRQLQLPSSPPPNNHSHKPALSDKMSLHYMTHLLILLFQVWICIDQCLPIGIPKESLFYPMILLSSIVLIIPKKRKIELGILYTFRFLLFVIASCFLDRGCQVINKNNENTNTESSSTTNIIYSVIIYAVSLISIFN
ncbi:putative protein kinase [Heterostelium album PN500]|uniref:non-specific serine/threonine protein kinase n=1 Tax=Heterostelium pallidum (strain ATCC 26659 / Pp 5 / PN500) TaxID=670386 RepID=D3BM37_HETP5|nr:putative protein kinase [Heterostelium album PN500]EFA77638.1 putative protein kinase [Heterostelium album PN500]|eukprot:XP_020429766.1 putative protein kinase [Heterostelium album PN500]